MATPTPVILRLGPLEAGPDLMARGAGFGGMPEWAIGLLPTVDEPWFMAGAPPNHVLGNEYWQKRPSSMHFVNNQEPSNMSPRIGCGGKPEPTIASCIAVYRADLRRCKRTYLFIAASARAAVQCSY